jgi:putative phosphoribosyl transferase
MEFKNRTEAGQLLAKELSAYADRKDTVVVALPRGGMPVGFEIAKALNLPLDVFPVRKLGVPGFEELAMGAIASGGFRVINEDVVRSHHISSDAIDHVAERERRVLKRREHLYRYGYPALDVYDSTVILVDDGIATGSTMRAAILALQQQQPDRILVAVPIASLETCTQIEPKVDEVICLLKPAHIYAVGRWYENFPQVTDKQVQYLLELSRMRQLTPCPTSDRLTSRSLISSDFG